MNLRQRGWSHRRLSSLICLSMDQGWVRAQLDRCHTWSSQTRSKDSQTGRAPQLTIKMVGKGSKMRQKEVGTRSRLLLCRFRNKSYTSTWRICSPQAAVVAATPTKICLKDSSSSSNPEWPVKVWTKSHQRWPSNSEVRVRTTLTWLETNQATEQVME